MLMYAYVISIHSTNANVFKILNKKLKSAVFANVFFTMSLFRAQEFLQQAQNHEIELWIMF